jgi:hypothetical protein
MVFTLRHESKLHIISHIFPHFTTLLISYPTTLQTETNILKMRTLKAICFLEIKEIDKRGVLQAGKLMAFAWGLFTYICI